MNDNAEIVSAEIVLLSKREATINYSVKNISTTTTLNTIRLKAVKFDDKLVTIITATQIKNLKAGDVATLEANVILPANYSVTQNENGELGLPHSEAELETSSNMSKQDFDKLPDWR